MIIEIPDWKKAKFIMDMSMIADNANRDKEGAHINADALLCDILNEIGLSEVADAFDSFDKWYS